MNAWMPGTWASLGRSSWSTSCADRSRWSRGLSRMKMMPLLAAPAWEPRAPTNDMNCSTFGSAWMIFISSSWWAFIDSNEIPSAPSVKVKMEPLSSVGRKPLGTCRKRKTVAARTTTSTPIVVEPVAQHRRERPVVEAEGAVEDALRPAEQPAVVDLLRRHQEAAAEHRRQRQRHEAGDQHRGADGHRELVEQPAEDAAHEQDRDEHRRQRQGHRHDGEADLLGPQERRLKGFSPSSMWRTMFSSMTIASSTTKPTESVSAISDRLSRL